MFPDDGVRTIELDYPVKPRPRYGHGRPWHSRLTSMLAAHHDNYRAAIAQITAHRGPMQAIDMDWIGNPQQPFWRNGWLPGLDGAALYGFTASLNPALYVEVGSGNSTKFTRRAISDHRLRTRIVSIDPMPRAECDDLCDEIIRAPFEEADLSVYARVQAGDIVFVDNSHRALQNSDATAFFLDVLPELPPGVLVGIHDITLPQDYPPEWLDRFYSEQYLLAAWLLGGGAGCEIVLPAAYVSLIPELADLVKPIWAAERFADVEWWGGAFWLRTA
jgi:Methyltransferase domain